MTSALQCIMPKTLTPWWDYLFLSATGLPDFSWSKHTKTGKIYQMAIKYKKCPQNTPNGHKIYLHFFHSKALQNTPKLGFWYESKLSGNPGQQPQVFLPLLGPLFPFFSSTTLLTGMTGIFLHGVTEAHS
jgi:hypothetical protein